MRIRRIVSNLALSLALALALAACDSVEERVQKHYDRGMELLEQGEPEKAELEFKNAIRLNSDFAPAHYQIGLIQEDKRDLSGAFRSFLLVTELDREHVEARVKVARLFMLRGDLDKAREQLDEAVALAPDDIGVLAMQVQLAAREKDYPAAKAALDTAKALAPEDVDVMAAEVEYLRRAESETLALAQVERALKKAPDDLVLNIAKLQILAALRDTLAIGDQLQKLIDLGVDVPRFRRLLYRWAVSTKRYELAEEQLRWFADDTPEDRDAVYELVRFVQQTRGVEEARKTLLSYIDKAEEKTELELLLARFDRDTGAVDKAVARLKEMIARNDEGSNEARTAYANILLAQGDRQGALKLVQETLANDENNVEALVIWGAHLIAENRLEEAVQAIRRGLNEQADDIRLLTLAGRAQERLGHINLANDRYAAAARLSGFARVNVQNYVDFLNRLERVNAVEAVLSEAARRRPQEKWFLTQLGFARVRTEDWPGANLVARALEKVDPEEARRLKAAILVSQEKFDAGASLLRTIAEEAGADAFAGTTALVQTYLAKGDLKSAISYLDELLAKDPENRLALGLRGNIHLAMGETDKAEEIYRRILALDPGNGGARSALMRVYAATGKLKDAENVLIEGLELSPNNLLLKTRLAQFRETQGRIDDAIRLYGEVIDVAPNAILVINNYASLVADYHSDDPELMQRAYQMAGRLRESSRPHFRDTYAWTRYLNGEFKEARAAMESVVKELPNNAWVRYHMGMILAALEENEAAKENLQMALDLAGEQDFPPREKVAATLSKISGG